jgi:hypothetical protein
MLKKVSRREAIKAGAAAGTLSAAAIGAEARSTGGTSVSWLRSADVVVIGAGATGVPAAIVAREAGASVLLIEAEEHAGGHAMVSGGNVPLGGGNAVQKKYGIADSADLLFADLTDWSVVQPNGFPDYRYNDREIIRAFADHNVEAYDWLRAHGVVFVDKAPDNLGGGSVGNSAARENHTAAMDWPMVQTGAPLPSAARATTSTGNGLMQPLLAAASKAGVETLLQHRMTSLHRAADGRITGIAVRGGGRDFNIRARKAVIIATGGSTGNVNFRRMFDPRLTEEYCGLAGMPWSNQDASGELAAMAMGASLWGLYNQTAEFGSAISKPGRVGCQYGYVNLEWSPDSRLFDRVGAVGLRVADWQNVITVNMLGKRFYDETGPQFTSNNHFAVDRYMPGSYRNARDVRFNPNNFINAALAGIGDGHNGGGAIWAIFDAEAVRREKWTPAPPYVDNARGFFFQADTVAELAAKIVMKHQRIAMPAATLAGTVARYNGFVDSGVDEDFGKPTPRYRIERAPFYAAWATPVVHDTRAGLRINAQCQVVDMQGQAIPGLYCGGESAGGFSEHGLARAVVQGLIAGHAAAAETARG